MPTNSDNLNDALIAHVNLARGFRGGERQTELLIRELAVRGIRQRLVARAGGSLIVRLADLDTLERVPVGGIWSGQRALRGAQLAHAHEGRCIQATYLARKLRGTPYVITRREVKPNKQIKAGQRAYRAATARVGLSQAIALELNHRAANNDATIIPSAFTPASVDSELVHALRARYGHPLIGHVGALVEQHKGQDLLIEVARRHSEWQFMLVGDGADEAQLKRRAAGLANVWFTGRTDDVASHLAACDVFAFPSRHEGLGSTLIDAMFIEVPIVATAVGGIPDLIEDDVNGLLVPPDSVDALDAAIARLLDDPALQTRFTAANRLRIADYSVTAMADRYLQVYQRCLGARR
ncbi:MAG: glycosyltransferase family 4 protein [Pseudomonadota bacterium]